MAYYKDLTPYDYSHRWPTSLNVGWLDGEYEFPTGDFPEKEEVLNILESLSRQNLCKGFHICHFCQEGGSRGNGEYHVIHKGQRYQAPTMIIHYMEAYDYKPPQEFIDAVLNNEE